MKSVTEQPAFRSVGSVNAVTEVKSHGTYAHPNPFQAIADDATMEVPVLDPTEYPECTVDRPKTLPRRKMKKITKSSINLTAAWQHVNQAMCSDGCCDQNSIPADPPPLPPPAQAPPVEMYDPLLHPTAVYDDVNRRYVVYQEEPKDRPIHPGMQALWKKFQEDARNGKGMASMLTERRREGINAVTGEEWHEFTATMDSGASEHAVPPSSVDHVQLQAGPKKGAEYECADGGIIRNMGERRCLVSSEGSDTINRIDLQVTEVHKPLLSVGKMIDAGQRVVFDPQGSYVEDTVTGDRIMMTRRDGVYELKLWAKQYTPSANDQNNSGPDFARPK